MKLLVDIGNSRIKWSCSNGEHRQMSSTTYTKGDLDAQLQEAWKELQPPEAAYIANVAGTDVAETVDRHIREKWRIEPVFMVVSERFNGLDNAYRDISQMGVDRWLALVAGWTMYKDNLCVISVGTAVTLDLVLAGGRHLGGYIIPGPDLMRQQLNNRTHGVKAVDENSPVLSPGASTNECVQNGVYLAIVALIERVIGEQQDHNGKTFRCIITGGGAMAIQELLTLRCDHEPDLVLKGVAIVTGGEA